MCGVVAGARGEPMLGLPVHLVAVSPSGAHRDRRYKILGMVLARFPGEDHHQSSSDEVVYE